MTNNEEYQNALNVVAKKDREYAQQMLEHVTKITDAVKIVWEDMKTTRELMPKITVSEQLTASRASIDGVFNQIQGLMSQFDYFKSTLKTSATVPNVDSSI